MTKTIYKPGDKVFCPYYGIATIKNITRKKVKGHSQQYYVIKIPSPSMKLMIPVEKAEEQGIYKITSEQQINQAIDELQRQTGSQELKTPPAKHIKMLKSTDLSQVATSVRILLAKDDQKGLSPTEKARLRKGITILASELARTKEITRPRAKKLIRDAWEK